jgi:Putative zinc-finger
MSCLSELTCALYADDELPGEERAAVERHLPGCARCRDTVAALREENHVLGAVLADAEREAAGAVAPVRRRIAAGIGLAAIAGTLAWGAGAGGPFGVDWPGLALEAGLFLVLNASALASLASALALLTMLALTVVAATYLVRQPPATIGLLVLALLIGPSPASALETRTGRTVAVAAGETVSGTLVASGDAVEIAGTVDGDLVVAARAVDIRGTVRGDLILAAGAAEIAGVVEGNVYAVTGALVIRGRIARNVYALGRATRLEPAGRIAGDLSAIARGLDLAGAVGRGVWILGATATVGGTVTGDLTVRAHRLAVQAPARIGGSLFARVEAHHFGFWQHSFERAGDLDIQPGATIAGARDTAVAPPGSAVYAEPAFYFWLGVQLFGALLLGGAARALVPAFFERGVCSVRAWAPSLGLGAALLIGLPVAALLTALTLVGLPLALIALGLYLLGLYAAKIVVGASLGRALLGSRGSGPRGWLPALALGVAVLLVGFELPVVGPALHVVVLCLGLGALGAALRQAARSWNP